MKKILILLFTAVALFFIVSCEKSEDVIPQDAIASPTPPPNPNDTLVKFTLYSNCVPYIWKRMVNLVWVQDTIKTNNAVRYEPFDKKHYGYGYWGTMNLAGIPTDSIHIIGEYKGKITQMASLKYQSAAYVLLDNIKP